MVVEKELRAAADALLLRGDKTQIAQMVRQQGLPCEAQDVSSFFTGWRDYHTNEKGRLIYQAALDLIEARKTHAHTTNQQFAHRLQALRQAA